MAEEEKETAEVTFKLKDEVSEGLKKITEHTEKLRERVREVTGVLLGVGGIGGAFEIKEAIGGINEQFRAMNRIRTMTQLTANEAFGLTQVFKGAGLSIQEAEQNVMYLTRRMEMLHEQGGAAMSHISAQMRRLGVDTKAGPVEQLKQMSIAVQKGKMGVSDLTRLFGVRGQAAVSLLGMLRKGPEHIEETMKEARQSGIGATTLGDFNRMQSAGRQLHEAFEGFVRTIYVQLIPGLTSLTREITHAVEDWTPHVEAWAKSIKAHMGEILAAAKLFGELMLLRHAAGLFGFTPAGIIKGAAGMLVKGAGKAFLPGFAGGFLRAGGGPIAGPVLGALTGGLGSLLKILSNFLKLSAIGIAIGVIVTAFTRLMAIKEWRERLERAFQRMREAFQRLWTALEPVFDQLAIAFGRLVEAVMWVVEKIADFLGKNLGVVSMLDVIRAQATGGRVVAGRGMGAAGRTRGPLSMLEWARLVNVAILTGAEAGRLENMGKAMRAKTSLDRFLQDMLGDYTKHKPLVNQDFRGSKFEITQQFAEGFDPDRIVAVMANQLGRLGERRLGGGYGPAFGGY